MKRRSRFTPVLMAFLALRLMMLITFLPEDLTRFGDYPYYYALARFSDEGYLPFIHYWSEHLPVFPLISLVIYRLSQLLSDGSYETYVYLLGAAMVAFDVGSLWLLMRLGGRLWGEEQASRLGWTYSVLFVPLIFCWWTFEVTTAFLMLFALHMLLEGREKVSAIAVGVGVLTKLIPLLILPAVVRVRVWRRWLVYALIVSIVVGAVVGPLLAIGGPYAAASFRSVFARSSYETVWALLDGNLSTGLLGSAADHFDLNKAVTPSGNPPRVPGWLKTGVFGLLGLFVFWQADLHDSPRRLVAFVCLTLVIFLLWSKGWSPQWQVFLFPLILLTLPYRRALLFILALSAVNIAEWPVLLSRGMNQWLYLTVLLRTGLLVLLGVELWQQVKGRPGLEGWRP